MDSQGFRMNHFLLLVRINPIKNADKHGHCMTSSICGALLQSHLEACIELKIYAIVNLILCSLCNINDFITK